MWVFPKKPWKTTPKKMPGFKKKRKTHYFSIRDDLGGRENPTIFWETQK